MKRTPSLPPEQITQDELIRYHKKRQAVVQEGKQLIRRLEQGATVEPGYYVPSRHCVIVNDRRKLHLEIRPAADLKKKAPSEATEDGHLFLFNLLSLFATCL